MNLRNRFILLLALGLTSLSYAQQDAQYTQYIYNTMSINPAFAGSRNVMNITGIYRNQWIGVGGAPVTQTLSLDSPIGGMERSAMGVNVVYDKIGPSSETLFDLIFSHTLQVGTHGQISLGLKAGVHLLDVDFNELNTYTYTDILLDTNVDNNFSPNFGIGALYRNRRFFVGLSAPNILETKHFERGSQGATASSFIATERLTYYLLGGYTFPLNQDVEFQPISILKAVDGAPLQWDISANFRFQDNYSLGLAYRWGAALSMMAGIRISDAMIIGMAYDWDYSELGSTQFNSGSYELMMRFDIRGKRNREADTASTFF